MRKTELKIFLVISIVLIITSLYAWFDIVQEYEEIRLHCETFPCYEAKLFLASNTHLIFGFGVTALLSFLLSIMIVDLIKQKD